MPVCNKYDINMAIHPDDQAGVYLDFRESYLHRKKLKRMMDMVPDKHNG